MENWNLVEILPRNLEKNETKKYQKGREKTKNKNKPTPVSCNIIVTISSIE